MEFFIKHKTIVLFILFTLFCFISLSLQSSGVTNAVEGAGNAVIFPFQKLYHAVQTNVSLLWSGFSQLRNAQQELEKTRLRLQQYESVAEELEEIKRENEQLRNLLGLKQRLKYDSVLATIISKDPDNWFRTIIINRGSSDGIEVNMPVVAFFGDEKAIVGKIIEVRGSISRIVPIISPDLKIGVVFQESRYPGLLSGYSAIGKLCVIDYVDKTATIKSGDIVITSGQGGVFPPGLLVGVAVKSFPSESGAFQRVLVKPYINFDLIENVVVIKKEPDKEILKLIQDESQL
ncbi:MAG: rod shape-determining protein MreC [Spirochaetota bacterium]